MKKIPIITVTIILVFLGICPAPAIERDGRGKSREPVEKTFFVGKETFRLRATITDDGSAIEVVRLDEKIQLGSTEDVSNRVARVVVYDLVPEAYDFALSRTGRLLWLVVHRDDLLPGGRKLSVYPLQRDDETQQYDFVRLQVSVASDRHVAVVSSLDLIRLLKQIGRGMWKKGAPPSFGLKPTISDLRIECPEGESAIVSGKLGTKYSFTGEIGLGEGKDCRFWTKGFEINEIDLQEDSQSDPLITESRASGQ